MTEAEFKEKARRHIYNCDLRAFPVAFEMYVRAFNLEVNLDESMAQIVSIIRTSQDSATAFELVCYYLDTLE